MKFLEKLVKQWRKGKRAATHPYIRENLKKLSENRKNGLLKGHSCEKLGKKRARNAFDATRPQNCVAS